MLTYSNHKFYYFSKLQKMPAMQYYVVNIISLFLPSHIFMNRHNLNMDNFRPNYIYQKVFLINAHGFCITNNTNNRHVYLLNISAIISKASS